MRSSSPYLSRSSMSRHGLVGGGYADDMRSWCPVGLIKSVVGRESAAIGPDPEPFRYLSPKVLVGFFPGFLILGGRGVAVLFNAKFTGDLGQLVPAYDRAHEMIIAAGGAERFGELRH